MILPWIVHSSKVNTISGWFTAKQALQVHFVSLVVHDCLAAILKGKCCGKWYSTSCNILLSVLFLFFAVVFIDKEENHLFENIVSFELYCSIYCCIFCLFWKKWEVHLNMKKCKPVWEDVKMESWRSQQTQNSWKIETFLIKKII